MLATTLVIGVIAAVAYVLHVAQSAPALDTLHPLLSGGSSQVFAADGTRLGFIQSDELRTPVGWSEIPADLKNATVAIEDQRFYKNDGVDLTGIFRAAVKDISERRAAAGRIDDHDAADAQPLPGRRPAHAQAEDHRGQAGDRIRRNTTASTRSSPATSTASPTGPSAGRRRSACRRRRASSSTSPSRELEPRAVGAARRPAAGAVAVQPLPRPLRRHANGATRCSRRWPNCTTSPAQAAAAEAAPLEVHHGNYYSERKEDFFFEYVRQQLIERYGAKHRRTGRAEGVHDDRPEHAAARAQSDRRSAQRARRPGLGDRHAQPANGDIEAMAESESYEQSQYNLAADGHRQPGSTFKAIDLADALSRGIDPNTTYYLSHTLEPGWLAGEPNYEVKTFEGTSLNKSMNLVPGDARLRQHRLRAARRRPRRGNDHPDGLRDGGQNPPLELSRRSARRADARRHAAGNGRRLRDARRRRLAQHADRDHQGRLPRRPRRRQLGQAAPREGAQRSRHRRGDEHPRAERPERHRDALGDQLPDRRQDGHHQRTRRRLARRLHARLLDGRVDGLPEQARLDDRRPRRAPAGRLPAGGNLARLHGRGHRRQAVRRRSRQPKETISYQPFYGKYASTGLAPAGSSEAQPPNEPAARRNPTAARRARTRRRSRERATAAARRRKRPKRPGRAGARRPTAPAGRRAHRPATPAAPAPG